MSFRRRKSLLFLLAVTCCLVYYNWFYQKNDSQLDDPDALFRRRLEQNEPKRDQKVVYADSDLANGHHQRRDTEHAKGAQDLDHVPVISEKDLKHLTAVLHNHKAFLLDVEVLSRIYFIDKHLETLDTPTEVKAYKLNILETFARLKQNDGKTPMITYGVNLDSLADLNDVS